MRDDELRRRLWLVHRHVPFDVVFSLTPGECLGMSIILNQFDGREFDWSRMNFR